MKGAGGSRYRHGFAAVVMAVLLGGCGTVTERETGGTKPPGDGISVHADGDTIRLDYWLPADSRRLYPDASWLPAPYRDDYTDLAATIRGFTQQSIERDGLGDRIDLASVTMDHAGRPKVSIEGTDKQVLLDFANRHRAFLSQGFAPRGLAGVELCKQTAGCWDPHPGDQPWAFFLPLGLAFSQPAAVTLLNYPPSDSLEDADYLDNFTMKRWFHVLESVGIEDPKRYAAIVDARPIAAPGSGQSQYMPDIATCFNDPGSDHYYVTPMIELLSQPPGHTGKRTLPVVVLGTPAREAWAEIIGRDSVDVLDVGTAILDDDGPATPWVAGNHPDVTSYQCCPGDPDASCDSFDLVADEETDLQVACIVRELAADPEADPEAVRGRCAEQWAKDSSPAHRREICVRAKLDYSFTSTGICKTRSKAEAFCGHYDDKACPGDVYDCKVPGE